MRIVLIAAALLAAGPVLAQSAPPAQPAPAAATERPTPRQTVQAVAGRIRDLYFDPAAGDRIARELETAAAAGTFDGMTDGRDLAAALSARLHPSDAHFVVVYDPDAPAGPPMRRMRPPEGAAPAPRPGGGPEARAHYGFRKVEILPGNVGYIDLRQFFNIDFQNPDDPARRAADAALTFVADADAVIFDLRDNGGGAPSMVGYLSSAFTPANAPIYNIFHSREGTQSEAPDVFHPNPRLQTPVYILISGRTGSAGEAFPYTLQGAGRAVIVGERSGGAANPGGMVPVGGGFAVFISQGSPRNPNTGRNWEGVGVEPDVAVPWNQALDRAHQLALEGIVQADAQRTDAAWALEAMRSTADAGDLAAYAGVYGEQTVSVVDGRLQIVRGRRPPTVLAPLGDDVFTVVGDPGRRVRFARDGGGRAVAFDLMGLGGPPMRARRTE